jgi:hypothetical protein
VYRKSAIRLEREIAEGHPSGTVAFRPLFSRRRDGQVEVGRLHADRRDVGVVGNATGRRDESVKPVGARAAVGDAGYRDGRLGATCGYKDQHSGDKGGEGQQSATTRKWHPSNLPQRRRRSPYKPV